jgi:5-hydroxyisourate hydrolase-like protein (transthyretin family)
MSSLKKYSVKNDVTCLVNELPISFTINGYETNYHVFIVHR